VAEPVAIQPTPVAPTPEPLRPEQPRPEPACCLPPDCLPWLHVARQVLAGEFDGGDRSTRESIKIGLCSVPHPLCRRALAWLQGHAVKP
jgi:hypothetical protein